MRAALLDLLRCPFCGGAFSPGDRPSPTARIDYGVLFCACCAYPVVDGIPVVTVSDAASQAIREIEAGAFDAALFTTLGLDAAAATRFRALQRRIAEGSPESFARAIDALLPDGEGIYYVLRFSDPTFLVAQAVALALGSRPGVAGRPMLDVCGGCGHLARVLTRPDLAGPDAPVVLCDASAWRLWAARRFVVPTTDVVCADANAPLPFRRGAFSLAACNDALHYVWGKRLLAAELSRAVAQDGVVMATHVHCAGGRNATEGHALDAAAYAELFSPWPTAVCNDAALLGRWLADGGLDLRAAACSVESAGGADSLTVIASRRSDVFVPHRVARSSSVQPGGVWRVNPLYRVSYAGDRARLRLETPTAEYEAEFGAVRAYLPADVDVPAELARTPSDLARARPDLVAQWVVLDVPADYLDHQG